MADNLSQLGVVGTQKIFSLALDSARQFGFGQIYNAGVQVLIGSKFKRCVIFVSNGNPKSIASARGRHADQNSGL
jgi:hypothetical protein